MRLIYLTDTHIQGGRPQRRKDDFLESVYGKLLEVIGLCRQHKVDFVIHGGDLFDNPLPDQRSLDLCRWFLRELDLPVYLIAGNHDLIEQRLDSLESTALGELARQNLIRLLQPGEKIYLADASCVVQLSGQHFYSGIDRRKNGDAYMVKKERCDLAVHVVHGMLLPKAFSDKVPCTLISKVAGTEADFTLGAHAHLGYHEIVAWRQAVGEGVEDAGTGRRSILSLTNESSSGLRNFDDSGRFFLNPGALVRLTGLRRELVRTPQVLYLDFAAVAGYSFIPLQAARPGREVLNLKEPARSKNS